MILKKEANNLPLWQTEFRRIFKCGWLERDKDGGLYRFAFRVTPETYQKWQGLAYGSLEVETTCVACGKTKNLGTECLDCGAIFILKQKTTPINIDDWISTLPLQVQEILRSKLSAAQGMYQALTAPEVTSVVGCNFHASRWGQYAKY